MAIKMLYFIITTITAPLLLAIHWLHSIIHLPTDTINIRSSSSSSLSNNNFQQKIMMDSSSGSGATAFHSDHGPDIDAPPPPPPPPDSGGPCSQPPYSSYPHCNTTLPKATRITHLLTHLTPTEKISLLGHDSPTIYHPRTLYLPAYKWWNEGLHGFAWTDCCPPYQWVNVTVFPQVVGLGMTWNRTLWNEIGGVIGTEALHRRRSMAEEELEESMHPGLTYFTPNINIFRDPRWGRGQETPGEDPYLTSHYAAVIVMSLQYGNGWLKQQQLLLQEHGDADEVPDDAVVDYAESSERVNGHMWRPRVAATCKHFAAYSLETNRFNFSANIHYQTSRDWNDTYLPAFDACIHAEHFLRSSLRLHHHGNDENSESVGKGKDDGDDEGGGLGALGVMCSYNSINNIPSCANPQLLQQKLRQEWGFNGYVVSDCWAINNIHEHHHYANSYEEAVAMSLRAGVDLDCGDTIQGYGVKALDGRFMDVEDVDVALGNLMGVLMDVGYFDPVDDGEQHQPQQQSTMDETASRLEGDETQKQYHDQVALEAALQSIVLLKNNYGSVPLSITTQRKITLIGPLANDELIPLGNYHGVPSDVITPLQGLQDLGVEVTHFRGCNDTDDVTDNNSEEDNDGKISPKEEEEEGSLCQQIMNTESSDATILIMGLNQDIEREEIDRTSLLLPKVEVDVIEVASRCSKTINPTAPVILVVMTGGPLDLSLYKINDDIDAILYTSYPGQAGGMALSHVLYGMYNPSGRLVTSMYPNTYLDRVALEDMRMRPEEEEEPNSNTLGNENDDGNGDRYPGRTYRFYDGDDVVYPFGYGLSYSSWDYSIELMAMEEGGQQFNQEDGRFVLDMTVNVSNTGSMDGSNSILLFHQGPNAGRRGNPIKSLIGFEKVFVQAGGTRIVEFHVEKKWMSSRETGTHTFMIGPSMKYTLQLNILDGGIVV